MNGSTTKGTGEMGGFQGKHDVYLIAEIGGNHEGNFEVAMRLTQLACRSGVDAVKLQIYTGDSLVNKLENPQRNKHFKRFELSKQQYIALAQYCHQQRVAFSASVWDLDAIPWIDPYMNFYKIGSGDMTAYPILRRIARIGKPMVLSTGLSTLEEIKASVRLIQETNDVYRNPLFLSLLQCTAMYPIPPGDANLEVMNTLRQTFHLPVGYSDHTEGSEAVETAVAMGADLIEVHFTDKRHGKIFRDHKISFTQTEIKKLIKKIEAIKRLQGKAEKTPSPSEADSNHIRSFRRAVYLKGDLTRGTTIKEEHLILLRPNHGIDARDYDKLLGKKLLTDVQGLHCLSWDYFD